MPREHLPILQQKARLRGKNPIDFSQHAKGGEPENTCVSLESVPSVLLTRTLEQLHKTLTQKQLPWGLVQGQ